MPIHTLFAESHAVTHVGCRRDRNEDRWLARDDLGLWAVADGMGGLMDGDAAAQAVIDGLAVVPAGLNHEAMVQAIIAAMAATSVAIARRAAAAGGLSGTTLAALLWCDSRASLIWCGDSRIYRWRGGRLETLSRDHNEAQWQVEVGMISAEAAQNHPGRHLLWRAIGLPGRDDIDVAAADVRAGDRFLICSDGLNGELSDADIGQILHGPRVAACNQLLLRTLDAGGRDNVSFVLVDFVAT
ncbi:serine/threonine-protein phosphatase [Sandarakinorhabdus sp.]|uniref:PP2C family protein-serine/threonine phosphatase n=1 Tax=Sandarakinorhabdus sp. TaxID=1916663 RepID=UPI00286D714B|nr:serine/threonine-protein phosphatase [Sandarakinorhabdus sp.]